MQETMHKLRKYEERISCLFPEGIMPAALHRSHGEEVCAVGVLYGRDD